MTILSDDKNHVFYKFEHIPAKYKEFYPAEYKLLVIQVAKELNRMESINYLISVDNFLNSNLTREEFIKQAKQFELLFAQPEGAYHLNIDQKFLNDLTKALNKKDSEINIEEVRNIFKTINSKTISFLDTDSSNKVSLYDKVQRALVERSTPEQQRLAYDYELDEYFHDNANYQNNAAILSKLIGAVGNIHDSKELQILFAHVIEHHIQFAAKMNKPFPTEFVAQINKLAIDYLDQTQLDFYTRFIDIDMDKRLVDYPDAKNIFYQDLNDRIARELREQRQIFTEFGSYIQRLIESDKGYAEPLNKMKELISRIPEIESLDTANQENQNTSYKILTELNKTSDQVKDILKDKLFDLMKATTKVYANTAQLKENPKNDKEKLHNTKILAIKELKDEAHKYATQDRSKWTAKEYMSAIKNISALTKNAVESSDKYNLTTPLGKLKLTESKAARILDGRSTLFGKFKEKIKEKKEEVVEKIKEKKEEVVEKITTRFRRS